MTADCSACRGTSAAMRPRSSLRRHAVLPKHLPGRGRAILHLPACHACTARALAEIAPMRQKRIERFTDARHHPSPRVAMDLDAPRCDRRSAPRPPRAAPSASSRVTGDPSKCSAHSAARDAVRRRLSRASSTSLGFDSIDVKLFFIRKAPVGRGRRPPMASRDYTPRRVRPRAPIRSRSSSCCTTPARRPAGPSQVQPGQSLRIGGPRGSFIIPDQFRLAPADRRRYRAARDRAAAGGASGRHPRRRPARGGRSRR